MLTALSTICLALSPVLAAPTVYNEERRAWAAPPCSQLNATEAQRLLYAQRWVERRTILPSLAEGISLVDR